MDLLVMLRPGPYICAGIDTSARAVVQRNWHFKLTSAAISPKFLLNSVFNTLLGISTSAIPSGLPAASVLTSLQCIFQHNTLQREEIIKLINYVEHSSGPMELNESFDDQLQVALVVMKSYVMIW